MRHAKRAIQTRHKIRPDNQDPDLDLVELSFLSHVFHTLPRYIPPITNETQEEEWYKAVTSGDLNSVNEAIHSQQMDVNLVYKDKGTPLHWCAIGDQSLVAEILIRAGADASVQANDGSTVLHAAAKEGAINTAILLLEDGAGKFVFFLGSWRMTQLRLTGFFKDGTWVYAEGLVHLLPAQLSLDSLSLTHTHTLIWFHIPRFFFVLRFNHLCVGGLLTLCEKPSTPQ